MQKQANKQADQLALKGICSRGIDSHTNHACAWAPSHCTKY